MMIKKEEIGTQAIKRLKALGKQEQRFSKFQAIVRGAIVRKRFN